MTVQPYTRPNRRQDMEFIAKLLYGRNQNGTYMVRDIDLLAEDIESRQAVVDLLEEASRRYFRMGAEGHHAYELPKHMSLISILQRERAELFARERRAA